MKKKTPPLWPKERPLVVAPYYSGRALSKDDAALILQRSLTNPEFFARTILGVSLWKTQSEILKATLSNHKRVAVKACHASGKSFVAAVIGMTFVHLNIPSVVVTTAPTLRQVGAVLWKEIHRIYRGARKPLGGRMLQMSYALADDTFMMGLTTDDPNKFQGFHSENILVIVDEGPGVEENVYEAIEGVMAGGNARLLLLGNPTSLEGSFYRAFNDPAYSRLFYKFTISAFDTPNVVAKKEIIPGLVTHQWVKERQAVWGVDHPLYQIKVLGEFPGREFGDLVIPPIFIERAFNVTLNPLPDDPVILGVDIGELGGDETTCALRRGQRLYWTKGWIDATLPQTVQRLLSIINEYKVNEVRIDKIGVGAGVYQMLKELENEAKGRWRVVGIDVREKPVNDAKYYDCRSEMWYEFRENLRHDRIDLSQFIKQTRDSDITIAQLTTPKFQPMPNSGLIKVESKTEMRRRGVGSPDRADAVVQAFYDSYVSKEPIVNIGSPAQIEAIMKQPKWTESGEGGQAPWLRTPFM